MALQDNVKKLRDEAIAQGKDPVPVTYQGVTKDRITAVLREIDRYTTEASIKDCICSGLGSCSYCCSSIVKQVGLSSVEICGVFCLGPGLDSSGKGYTPKCDDDLACLESGGSNNA